MTPQEFIAKWKRANLSERSACQQHFLDLCDLLGQPKPAAADPDGSWYTFERGLRTTGGEQGWADVWLKGHFGWEYKGKHKNLATAYQQLLKYREALENPPLLVVCDLDRFEVHTNFTGTAKTIHVFDLDGLAIPANLDVLRRVFTDPHSLRPGETVDTITQNAAAEFGHLAEGMRDRGIEPHRAAHFLMKLMFCMFAEDIALLGGRIFSRVLDGSKFEPVRLSQRLRSLFLAMRSGGDFGPDAIPWFNGGLFDDDDVVELTSDEIAALVRLNDYDWGNVEPSIFGTLFERTLDPAKRSQIGAHYTSREDIETLLEPVVMAPLRSEWAQVRGECEKLVEKIKRKGPTPARLGPKSSRHARKPQKESGTQGRLWNRLQKFIEYLAHKRILDPACGSGNFLYVTIRLLLELEKEVITYAAKYGISLLPQVRPTQVDGIEINPYAQQLAQVVIWIGYLQWMHHNGFNAPRNPILEPIENIRLMDAILDLSDPDNPKEPDWPKSDFIVGNPPFLGSTEFARVGLTRVYINGLSTVYALHGKSDLCCYWFELARRYCNRHVNLRAGLLATQSIRHGGSRQVLDAILADMRIFFAESNRPWILDGAAVRISMVGFGRAELGPALLDGLQVETIFSDLTANVDVTGATQLVANAGRSFEGDQKGGPFDEEFEAFASILLSPNPNCRPNSDVIRPRANAERVYKLRRQLDWIVDFGTDASFEFASRYEAPFAWLENRIADARRTNPNAVSRRNWWIHKCPRVEMRNAIGNATRYLVTPRVGRRRIFTWLPSIVLPDSRLFVFAGFDDCDFGIMQSRIHEVWALRKGARHGAGNDPTYNNIACFETFPFPESMKEQRTAIAAAAKELDDLRNHWLNPPEWTREEILEFPGSVDGPWKRYVAEPDRNGIGTVKYPRLVPVDEAAATKLKQRTLTNLYSQRPTWLDLAHRKLDAAVFAAYGWPESMNDDNILAALLERNLEMAANTSTVRPRRAK